MNNFELSFAHFRFRGCKNRGDSHGRRHQQLGNEEALLDCTANRGPIQGEPNTRGHGSFRRLLSSIISPVRGRPRVVRVREGRGGGSLFFFHINSARPRALLRRRPFFVSFLFSRLSYNPGFVPPLPPIVSWYPTCILTEACLVVRPFHGKRIDKRVAVCCDCIVAINNLKLLGVRTLGSRNFP